MNSESQNIQEIESIEKKARELELNDTNDKVDAATKDDTTTENDAEVEASKSETHISNEQNNNDASAADENTTLETDEQNSRLKGILEETVVVKNEAEDTTENNLSVTLTEPAVQEEMVPVNLPDALEQCAKDEYFVKTIHWKQKTVRIITQNKNGPCPLVAISNVLLLRGDLEIQPPDREVVTFEYLVDRLGDYLLNHAPTDKIQTTDSPTRGAPKRQGTSEVVLTYRHNLDSALSILPNLKSGLDVNVKFDSIHGFEPTAELAMFDIFHVDLVHGWIVDPQDTETYQVIANTFGTYNKTVESIIQMDMYQSQQELTKSEEEKLHQGFLATEFLRDTATQLTYYGLDLLLDSIPVDTLCVLFRNNHFSTIYRHPNKGLFMLVTDSGLLKENDIVWESLGDVDQSTSEFLNGMFNKSSPNIQGNERLIQDEELDLAIAMSLQEQQPQQNHNRYSYNEPPQRSNKRQNSHNKKKNSDGCIIQ